MADDRFISVYESIRRTIEPKFDSKRPGLGTSILIRDILNETKRLGIKIKESEIDSFLQGLITYFSKLNITARETGTLGERSILFIKIFLFLEGNIPLIEIK